MYIAASIQTYGNYAHAGQNRDVCLSAHGRLLGTLWYNNMYLLEQPKEHVGVYSSLVGFVQHHDGVLLQVSIDEALSEEHAVCHVLYHCLLARHILKSNCIANLQSRIHKINTIQIGSQKYHKIAILEANVQLSSFS